MAGHYGFLLSRCVDRKGKDGGAVQFLRSVLDIELVIVEVISKLARLFRYLINIFFLMLHLN